MKLNQRKMGVLLSYIGELVKILSSLLYTPVMLRLLGTSEYGLYQLVYSVVSNLSLLSLGFGSAYVRFFSKYKAQKNRTAIAQLNGMFMVVFTILSIICLLCGSVMVGNAHVIFGTGITGEELEKAKLLFAIMVLNMAMTFPNSVYNCYITAHERFIFQKFLRVLQNLLNPFLTLPLLLMGYGSVAVVIVSTVLTAAVFFSNIFYCKRKLNMEFSYHGLHFTLLKEIGTFTFFIFLNQIIDQVNWSVDKFLLGRMSGTVAVAVYGVGAQINTMYMQTSTTISNVFIPKVNMIVASSNDDYELTELMTRVGRIQLELLALIASGFVFFGRLFIRLWAGVDYAQAYEIALILIIPATVPLMQNIGIEIQRAKNMHKARSVVYLCIAVANVIISWFLIQIWGAVGAAVGTAISLIAGNILFMNWYYHKKIGLNILYFWKQISRLIPAILLTCLFGFVYVKIMQIKSLGDLLIAVLAYCAVYLIAMWNIGFNEYEKKLIYNMIARLHFVGKKNDRN